MQVKVVWAADPRPVCRMNPLGIKPENFTIVEESSGNIVAFAQLQQLSAANTREFR